MIEKPLFGANRTDNMISVPKMPKLFTAYLNQLLKVEGKRTNVN
jgi:hypothetical protein